MKNVACTQALYNRAFVGIATLLLGTTAMLSAQSTPSYNQLVAAHPGWVQVPGELIRPDCIHQIPAGASVSISDDSKAGEDIIQNGAVIAHYDACSEEPIVTRQRGGFEPGPVGNGWVEDSNWVLSLKKGDNIEWIQNEWVVPSAPKSTGATIFLFNGVEPKSGKWIMQPVLQYGSSYAGGGNYWTMASWLVGSSVYVSTLTPVHAGDLLVGTTDETNVASGKLTYLVDAWDSTSGADSNLTVHSKGIQWGWAFEGVLEAYNVTKCTEFPASGKTRFYNTTVAHGYPAFDQYGSLPFNGEFDNYFGGGGPSCGFSTSVSGGSATLKY